MKHESNTEFFINVGKLAEIIEIWQAPEADIEASIKLLDTHTCWGVYKANQPDKSTIYHLHNRTGYPTITLTDFEGVWNHQYTQTAFKELVYELCIELYEAHDSEIDWDEPGELAAIARNLDFTFDRLIADYVFRWAQAEVYEQNCILEAICQKLGTTLKEIEELD